MFVILLSGPNCTLSVHWLARSGAEYREIEPSNLVDLGASQLAEQID